VAPPAAAVDQAARFGAEPSAPPATVGRATSAGEALRRFHDTYSTLGAVRVVSRPVTEDPPVLTDFDPFAS
jgi:hypothetical protein